MANTHKAREVLEAVARKIVDCDESDLPDLVSKVAINWDDDTPCSKWSRRNRLLCLLEGTSDARGIKQWNSVGRHVKKGSHAFLILTPRVIKEQDDDSKEEITKVIGFGCAPVFKVEDTEGDPLPEYEPKEKPKLLPLCEHLGIKVAYGNSQSGESGYIRLESKSIHLSTESPDTFLHELAHYYDHKIVGSDKWINGQDAKQEAVAQLAACVLARLYTDHDALPYTHQYIRSYSKAHDQESTGKLILSVVDRTAAVIEQIVHDASDLKIEVIAA